MMNVREHGFWLVALTLAWSHGPARAEHGAAAHWSGGYHSAYQRPIAPASTPRVTSPASGHPLVSGVAPRESVSRAPAIARTQIGRGQVSAASPLHRKFYGGTAGTIPAGTVGGFGGYNGYGTIGGFGGYGGYSSYSVNLNYGAYSPYGGLGGLGTYSPYGLGYNSLGGLGSLGYGGCSPNLLNLGASPIGLVNYGSVGPYGAVGGYNPLLTSYSSYLPYGYGGYSPYSYGGYSPYSYGGYSPYGYGGYSPYSYGGYSPYGYGGYPSYGYGGYSYPYGGYGYSSFNLGLNIGL